MKQTFFILILLFHSFFVKLNLLFFILAPSPSEGIEGNQETIENVVSNQETIEDVVSNQETTETFQETAKEDLSTQGTILCNQGRC